MRPTLSSGVDDCLDNVEQSRMNCFATAIFLCIVVSLVVGSAEGFQLLRAESYRSIGRGTRCVEYVMTIAPRTHIAIP